MSYFSAWKRVIIISRILIRNLETINFYKNEIFSYFIKKKESFKARNKKAIWLYSSSVIPGWESLGSWYLRVKFFKIIFIMGPWKVGVLVHLRDQPIIMQLSSIVILCLLWQIHIVSHYLFNFFFISHFIFEKNSLFCLVCLKTERVHIFWMYNL